MRYALLVYSDQSDWSDISEVEGGPGVAPSRCRAGSPCSRRSTRPIRRQNGKELVEASEAKVVRVRDGERSSPTARSPRRRS